LAALSYLDLAFGPALALRISNPLASLGAQLAALLPSRLRGFFRLFGCEFSYLGFNFSGAAQQGANLCKARNFGVD
jgi:hypothetical protein